MKQKPLKTKQKTEILALMNTTDEPKNSEESFNRRLHYAEERISNWEDRSFEIRQLEQQKEKNEEESLRKLQNIINRNNL